MMSENQSQNLPGESVAVDGGNEQALADIVHRNIDALSRMRVREESKKKWADRLADGVTGLVGNLWWVSAHAFFFGGWFLINLGRVPKLRPFDPFPFELLATITYVEAIFLSSFILISQNRARRLADKQAELNVQVSLLTEHELTHAVHLLDAIARQLRVEGPANSTLDDIKKEVSPDQIVREIERAEENRTPT